MADTQKIRALRNLDVDGVRIAEGAVAEIRRELVPSLIAVGAVDDEVEEAPAADGDEAAGASSAAVNENAAVVNESAAAEATVEDVAEVTEPAAEPKPATQGKKAQQAAQAKAKE